MHILYETRPRNVQNISIVESRFSISIRRNAAVWPAVGIAFRAQTNDVNNTEATN